MSTLTVEVEVPASLTDILNVSATELPTALQKLIVLELFREGHISAGKGAEILNMRKWEFIQLLSKYDIDYIDLSLEEVEAEVAEFRKLRKRAA